MLLRCFIFCSSSQSLSGLSKLPKLVYTPSVMGPALTSASFAPQSPLLRPCSYFAAFFSTSQNKSCLVLCPGFCTCPLVCFICHRDHIFNITTSEKASPTFQVSAGVLSTCASPVVAFITLFSNCWFAYLFSSTNLGPLTPGTRSVSFTLVTEAPSRSPVHICSLKLPESSFWCRSGFSASSSLCLK